jgi:hypothetical protein
MSLEQSGGGDLTMRFSDGDTVLDCTSPQQTIALTAGTDSSPQQNYIYVLQSDKILTKHTSQWPSAEHIKVGYFLVPSAAEVQAGGCYINQNWNDHRMGTDSQGHLSHMAEAIRLTMRGAVWHSGVAGNATASEYLEITGTAPSVVEFKSTAGVSYQMHKHTVPAIDMSGGDVCHVVNWNGDAYHKVSDLADIVADSAGGSLSNKYFNLVFWGVANKTGEYAPLMCNLPSGSYSTQAGAELDLDNYTVSTIPHEFTADSTTGFLICRLTVQQNPSGTWTLYATEDLRGVIPGAGTGAAGSGGALTDFPDNQFTLYDSDDNTRIVDLDLSGITTGNTRTLAVPDQDGTIFVTTAGSALPLTGDLVIDWTKALQVDVGLSETPTDAVQGNSFGIVFGDAATLSQFVGSSHYFEGDVDIYQADLLFSNFWGVYMEDFAGTSRGVFYTNPSDELALGHAAFDLQFLGSEAAPEYNGTLMSLDGHSHSDYLNKDGSVALTADWDVGNYNITAKQFVSDVGISPPFIVTSGIKVTNLNADKLDGLHETAFVRVDGSNALSADWDAGSHKITAEQLESDIVTGTPPFVVASTTMVPNLNADRLDTVQGSGYLRTAGNNACTGPFPLGEQPIIMTVSNDSGSGMSKGDLCYISGDSSGVPQVTLADADAEASASKALVVIHETIGNGSDGDAALFGVVTGFTGLTAGAIQYVHTTAGDFTETAPSGSADIVRVCGYAISTTEIFFNPGGSFVEIA